MKEASCRCGQSGLGRPEQEGQNFDPQVPAKYPGARRSRWAHANARLEDTGPSYYWENQEHDLENQEHDLENQEHDLENQEDGHERNWDYWKDLLI